MLNTDYKIKQHDKNFLEKNGFWLNHKFSCQEETIYTKRFPIRKYNDRITFDGRFMVILETGEVRIDVIDNSDGSLYGPWYYEDNQLHKPLTDQFVKAIEKEMRKVGITHARKNKNKVSQ